MTRRLSTSLALVATLIVGLAYLRDPPWLVHVTSGLTDWQTDQNGDRFRWTRGRASFFVAADAELVTLRLRAPRDDPRDWPITATITIDDRPAHSIKVDEEEWSTVRLRLPPPGARRLRRIDIKLDRVRAGSRGVQLQVEGS